MCKTDKDRRIEKLELALKSIRAKAQFEYDNPTGIHLTCLSLIAKEANEALAFSEYRCTICGESWVDAESGFDTCDECLRTRV